MKTTIPSKVIVTCDACKRECDNSLTNEARRIREGQIIIKCHLLDMQGSRAASGDTSIDLCDECLFKMEDAINTVSVNIWKKIKEI